MASSQKYGDKLSFLPVHRCNSPNFKKFRVLHFHIRVHQAGREESCLAAFPYFEAVKLNFSEKSWFWRTNHKKFNFGAGH
jgi:hypothetical protein